MNYKEVNHQKKIIILGGTYTDKNDMTIRGRRSFFFRNPSLGGTYTRHNVDQSEAEVFYPRWWDIHTEFSPTNQRSRRMGPFHALLVGHTIRLTNQKRRFHR